MTDIELRAVTVVSLLVWALATWWVTKKWSINWMWAFFGSGLVLFTVLWVGGGLYRYILTGSF